MKDRIKFRKLESLAQVLAELRQASEVNRPDSGSGGRPVGDVLPEEERLGFGVGSPTVLVRPSVQAHRSLTDAGAP